MMRCSRGHGRFALSGRYAAALAISFPSRLLNGCRAAPMYGAYGQPDSRELIPMVAGNGAAQLQPNHCRGTGTIALFDAVLACPPPGSSPPGPCWRPKTSAPARATRRFTSTGHRPRRRWSTRPLPGLYAPAIALRRAALAGTATGQSRLQPSLCLTAGHLQSSDTVQQRSDGFLSSATAARTATPWSNRCWKQARQQLGWQDIRSCAHRG